MSNRELIKALEALHKAADNGGHPTIYSTAAAALEAHEWRDIADAPKRGRVILGNPKWPRADQALIGRRTTRGWGMEEFFLEGDNAPTHYMPLPDAPKGGSYADVIIHGVKAYETEISNLRAERDALQAKLDVVCNTLQIPDDDSIFAHSKISYKNGYIRAMTDLRQALSAIKEGE